MTAIGPWQSLRLAVMSGCLLLMALPEVFASSGALTYHGRLLKPDGRPVQSSSVQFLLQIRSPLPTNCLMYQEIHTKDLSQNHGVFSLAINDGTATTVNTEPFGLDRVFQNYGEFQFLAGKCSGSHSYKPGAMDSRSLYVSFNDGTFVGWEPLPAQQISFVPSALNSISVGGFQADHLLRVIDASDVPVVIDPWTEAQFQKLLDIRNSVTYSGGHASITGTASGFTGSLVGDVTGGQTANKVERLQGRSVLDSAPSNGQVLTWNNAQSRWEPTNLPVAGNPAWNDITGKPTEFAPGGNATGDLTGTYPNPTIATSAVSGDKIADGGVAFSKIAAGSATGQVLQYEAGVGGGWKAGKLLYTDLIKAGGGSPWPTTPCTAGKAVVWQSATDGFECAAISITEADPLVKDFAKADPSTDFDTSGGNLVLKTVPITRGGTGAVSQSGAINNLLPSQGSNSGKILQTDGTNVSWVNAPATGITSINGATGSSQTFQTAQSNTAPTFTRTGDVHTLNIPQASTNGVTAGTISYTEYQAFSGKQNALGFTPLNPANNLSELTAATARTNLGLGTAATKAYGTAVGNLVEVGAGGKIPASLLPDQSGPYFTQGGNAFGAPAVLGTTEAQPLHLQTGGTNKVTVLAGGNVGIGTTNPSERLEVTGNIKASQLCIGADCRSAWPAVGGGGTVTSVATGTGLTGGPITSSGTISIANGGVGTTQIADDAVTTVKIANAQVTDAKIAGVSVHKINSGAGLYLTYAPNGAACALGQVLKWNNSRWECGADNNAGGTVTSLSVTAPLTVANATTTPALALTNGSATGQMLRWNGSAWQASTDGSGLTALNASNLGSGSIPAARIAAGTITSSHIANGTIVDADIASGTISSGKLASAVANGLWTANGANIGRPTGNVGIGTTTPGRRLTVYAATSDFAAGFLGSPIDGGVNIGPVAGIGKGGVQAVNASEAANDLILNPWGGSVGVGTHYPAATLDIAGEVKFGNTAKACNAASEGQQRYNSTSKQMEFCNGTVWSPFVAASSPGQAKAWVNFDGSSCSPNCSIRSSYNVTSVVRVGVGNYTVNFTSAMANANYVVVATGYADPSDTHLRTLGAYSRAAASFNVRHVYENVATAGAAFDYPRADIVVFGN